MPYLCIFNTMLLELRIYIGEYLSGHFCALSIISEAFVDFNNQNLTL